MRVRVRFLSLLAAGLALGVAASIVACYDGVGTLGAVCYAPTQCGIDQGCVNSICGLCNNRQIDPGELCFGTSSEENVFGEVSDLLAYDPEGDGVAPLLIATVNTNCQVGIGAGPPTMGGPACWRVLGLVIDTDGDFEVTDVLDQPINDGLVPQAGTGNFDGESTMDMAIAIFPSDPGIDQSQLVVAHNLALGDAPPVVLPIDISVRAKTLHAADLDGDGLDDLLIGGESSGELVELISTPGVGFQNERLQVISDSNPIPAPPIDMDNDGDLDVVLVSPNDGTVSVYLNDGNGNLSREGSADVAPPLTPGSLAAADFDRDGNADVAVFAFAPPTQSEVASEVQIYRGGGDGSIELDQTLPGGELPVSGLAVDVNFDGWVDIIIADVLEDKLPVHINRGGSFPDIVTIDVASLPRALMYEDFDFDQVPDLVIGSANGAVAVVPSEI